ncbi:hypothetical protein BD309DRAFT_958302 [Dichomitus squalens]|uniref:Uncharacterized protein n=1 Tax=Dichomitus squalens TaxID=114155 RepID=A0A4Q9NS95_9APHY|nr:hypothetical protein BD309DRAFT_958302 [Dichomitus squalens]TBU54641.1 hypothetical protein BD310DRAFT_1041660 [Dichomitus squalens]
MSGSQSRKYSAEEKEQLLANLDLEVAHKTRQFEDWLEDTLENFRRHQETLISRMPRIVRSVTMREFAKYKGDIQAAVKGLSRELLGSEDATIDLTTRKRKWVESQEVEGKEEPARGVKNARTVVATPKKNPVASVVPQSAQKSRLPITKTPAKTRNISRIPSGAVSPSPQKGVSKPLGFPRTPSRFASPAKPSQARATNSRVPSSSTFNPVLPSEASHPRWPRKDERLRSANGSPLANPYQLDLKNWFKAVTEEPEPGDSGGKLRLNDGGTGGGGGARTLKKQRSIIVRSTSSSSSLAAASHGSHSRSASQASTLVGAHSPTQEQFGKDQRKGSTVGEQVPLDDPFVSPSFSALVSVQTKDGHVLEFNPLQTSPEELDALEGITDSAKKQAKEDMARMIQATFERWRIS